MLRVAEHGANVVQLEKFALEAVAAGGAVSEPGVHTRVAAAGDINAGNAAQYAGTGASILVPPVTQKAAAKKVVTNIRRATRKPHLAEERIRSILADLRGEDSSAELCRRVAFHTVKRVDFTTLSFPMFVKRFRKRAFLKVPLAPLFDLRQDRTKAVFTF